jgi:branched-subunit amino acid permease
MFTMVFAHGPIIFPGILGLGVKPYRSFFYVWFCLLITSVCLRIIGDITLNFSLRSWSGLLSSISVLGFFVSMASMMTIEVRKLKAVRK